MNLIKLNAIDSTNSFLKEMAKNSTLKNYTVVATNQQTKGRGQRNASWSSEPNKNLTFSVYITDLNLAISHQKYLNFAISLAIFDVLSTLLNDQVFIKWPNDIMSVEKKICGILIENSIRKEKIKHAIVGIGLNANQENFTESIKNVTSLRLETGKNYDLDMLLKEVISKIKEKIEILSKEQYVELETEYLKNLYKKGIETTFKSNNGNLFTGKIIGVSPLGSLQIKTEEGNVKEFGIKEVSFA